MGRLWYSVRNFQGCFEEDVVRKCSTCVYDFVRTGKKAAVMWSEAHFYGEPVDAAFKIEILKKVVAPQNFRSDKVRQEITLITARTAAVSYTHLTLPTQRIV